MNTPAPVKIAARNPRRVRFDLDAPLADKLRAIATQTNRTQTSIIEEFIESLLYPIDSH